MPFDLHPAAIDCRWNAAYQRAQTANEGRAQGAEKSVMNSQARIRLCLVNTTSRTTEARLQTILERERLRKKPTAVL